MDRQERMHLVQVATGREKAGLVLKQAHVFQAYTGEFIVADVAIEGGWIAGIGNYEGKEEIDCTGKYITPGFIDGHVHIESSMLSPMEFARAVVPAGTTTVVSDPHEIANVAGQAGISYMMKAAESVPMNTYFMLPSCVPATGLEDSGAKLSAEDLAPFLADDRVLGLAEMMNVPGVLFGDAEVYAKLAIVDGCRIEGHAPALAGKDLMGYAAAGIHSDHECVTAEEGRARLRAGLHLLIREGSAARNLKGLLPVINAHTAPFCSFVTDDRHPADLLTEGSINYMVRLAVSEGLSPETALQMATVYAAQYFGLRDIGVIAPHYRADLLVFDDLETFKPRWVFKDGVLAAREGNFILAGQEASAEAVTHSVHLAPLDAQQLMIPMKGDQAHVIDLIPHQILTRHAKMQVTVRNGEAVSDPQRDILKMAVFERHHATGQTGAALVHGFGLQTGAIASTVAHDSHNLIVLGVSDDDMLLAAKELERIGGGLALVQEGRVLGSLPLPIGGLMTSEPAGCVAAQVAELQNMAYGMGISRAYDPFLTLAFLSLPVIPSLKLTDRGLVDVEAFRFIKTSVE